MLGAFMPQVEICLNDVRMNPVKYKPAYACNYDTDIAPNLMTKGRRLPLNRANTPETKAADRFPCFLCWFPETLLFW
jgi:hypothetical protein